MPAQQKEERASNHNFEADEVSECNDGGSFATALLFSLSGLMFWLLALGSKEIAYRILSRFSLILMVWIAAMIVRRFLSSGNQSTP